MLRLTRTAIGLLTAQYRSVLKKCWAINVGVFSLMGKAVASVANGAADTIGGALNGYGINVMAYMLGLLDSLLNLKSNAFDEQSAKAPATELPFDAPTVAGTFSFFDAENGNVTDDLSIMQLFKNKLFTAKTLPTALVAATVMATTLTAMPTEAEALKWCISNSASTTPLKLVANNTNCPDGYANFGTQSGTDSIAFGNQNTASGTNASAFGYGNIASMDASSAFGYGNIASGESSSAYGLGNTASGSWSSAFGYSNTASGDSSSAFGYINTASGILSSAFGRGNTASGENSSAFGYINTASGTESSAFGSGSYAVKNYTTAIGYMAVANVDVTTNTSGDVTQGIISVGHKKGDPRGWMSGNYTSDYFSRIINVANGTDAHDAATVGQMNTALNNYYRKEDLDGEQVIDFARYFKTGKFGKNARFLNDKSTIFEALATKVPAAELRCKIVNETSQEFAEMPYNSPTGEGTLSAFHRKAESVMDNLSKCRAANDNFIKDATTFLRAI